MTPEDRSVRLKFQAASAATAAAGICIAGGLMISRPSPDLAAPLAVASLALLLVAMVAFIASRAW